LGTLLHATSMLITITKPSRLKGLFVIFKGFSALKVKE
jgi:hypothetical protein